jgi:hypothetical protein
LYSADWLTRVTGAPHSLQNFEFGGSSVPHDPHNSPAAVGAPLPSTMGSMSVSFHRCSAMSVISPWHFRHEVSRPSYVVFLMLSPFVVALPVPVAVCRLPTCGDIAPPGAVKI